MASLQKRRRGSVDAYQIQFTLTRNRKRERKTLYLGAKYSKDFAEEIRGVVVRCANAIETGDTLDRRTVAWLSSIEDDLRVRFENAELLEKKETRTVRELYDEFAREKEETENWQLNTVLKYEYAFKRFFLYFPADVNPEDVTVDEARNFFLSMYDVKITSRSSYLKNVSTFFNWLVEKEVIASNPFAKIKKSAIQDKTREFFISKEVYQKLLDNCKTKETRVLLAVYRYGGLRKLEATALTWEDFDFVKGEFTVRSPKTKRHKSFIRTVPIFPELLEELEKYRKPASSGLLFQSFDPYERVLSVLKRAKIEPWERLIQNFRSTRSIEINRKFGPICESAWLGHSPKTAMEHYIHVTEEDVSRALKERS